MIKSRGAFRLLHSIAKTELLLGCTCLGTLGTILAAALRAVLDTGGIESAAHDVVANAGKVLHTAATHEHNAVFLKIVALAGDVGVHFFAIGEAHASYLTHSRVRLFGSGGVDANAHATTLGAAVERGALALVFEYHATLTY